MERQPGNGIFADFAKLLREAKAGIQEAKEKLYLPYQKVFRQWANRAYGRELRPERDSDVVQGIFVTAWQSFDQFQGGTEEEFTSWLRTIFHNELRRMFRYHHRERRDISRTLPLEAIAETKLTDTKPTPLNHLVLKEERKTFSEALKSLPKEEQALIAYHYVLGKAYGEIAGELGCSADAARKKCHRALADLLHQLPRD